MSEASIVQTGAKVPSVVGLRDDPVFERLQQEIREYPDYNAVYNMAMSSKDTLTRIAWILDFFKRVYGPNGVRISVTMTALEEDDSGLHDMLVDSEDGLMTDVSYAINILERSGKVRTTRLTMDSALAGDLELFSEMAKED